MNRRQERCIAALRECGRVCQAKSELKQRYYESAAWYVYHPNEGWIRLCLTCRDVMGLVTKGIITSKSSTNILGRRELVEELVE